MAVRLFRSMICTHQSSFLSLETELRAAQPCLLCIYSWISSAHQRLGEGCGATNSSPVENKSLVITDVTVCKLGHKLQGAITWTRGSCNASAPYPERPCGRSTVLGSPAYPPAWLGGYVLQVQKPCEAREQKCEYNRRLGRPFHFGCKD